MIENIKFTSPEDISFSIGSQSFSVSEGTAAYRKHVQPYLDSGKTIPAWAEPELTWEEKRIEEYGKVTDQLDEIYHDIDGWKTRIAGVKTKHPKP